MYHVCVNPCVCVCVRVRACVCVSVWCIHGIYVYVCMHTCMQLECIIIYVRVCVCVCVCVCIFDQKYGTVICMYVCLCVVFTLSMCVSQNNTLHLYACTCVHVHTYTCIYTLHVWSSGIWRDHKHAALIHHSTHACTHSQNIHVYTLHVLSSGICGDRKYTASNCASECDVRGIMAKGNCAHLPYGKLQSFVTKKYIASWRYCRQKLVRGMRHDMLIACLWTNASEQIMACTLTFHGDP